MKIFIYLLANLCLPAMLVAQVIYLSTTDNRLFKINVNDCQPEFVASVEPKLFDIAFHPNGELYGIDPDGVLYQIDKLTGIVTRIHGFSGQTFNSLTISYDGLIFTTGWDGELWSYNISNDEEIYYGEFGHAATGDMMFYNGRLYVAATRSRIILIDLDNPMNSTIVIESGTSAYRGTIYGLVPFAEDCSNMGTYAITNNFLSVDSWIYEVDINSGDFNLICELDFQLGGAATTSEFNTSAILVKSIDKFIPNCEWDFGRISVEATSSLGPLDYSIDGINFQAESQFNNLPAGLYSLMIRDLEGCTLIEPIDLRPSNFPSFELIQNISTSCNENDGVIEVEGFSGIAPYSYFIDEDFDQISGLFDHLSEGSYGITIEDSRGCMIDTTIVIKKECPIFIPNAFSPNGDGNNDLFKIFPPEEFIGQITSLRIYNRWGSLLFESNDPDPEYVEWDGTSRGQILGIGIYVYVLEYLRGDGIRTVRKGDITLAR